MGWRRVKLELGVVVGVGGLMSWDWFMPWWIVGGGKPGGVERAGYTTCCCSD